MSRVIGLTGLQCSGKGTFRQLLKELTGYQAYALSDILREELRKKEKEVTRDSLVRLGNELRKKHGSGVLARMMSEQNEPPLIIDSINNPAEVEELRKKYGKNFVLVNVRAEPRVRFERIKSRGREKDPKTWNEFLKMTRLHCGEGQGSYGQLINKCEETADFVVQNNEGLKELMLKAKALIDHLQ
jgi:dephospho-CoA kinase